MMTFPLSLQTFAIGEQQISLYVPDAQAVKEAYESGAVPFPYWSKVWPAAVALSKFIEEHRQFTENKNVLELGAGLGLPSLLAARYAKQVLCTDHSEDAVIVLVQSAAHQGLKNFKAAVVDWRCLPSSFRADLLLLSDVNYEPEGFTELTNTVNAFLNQGGVVLLSTPQRLVAKAFVTPFSAVCVDSKEYEVNETALTVMVLEKRNK